MSDNFLNTEQFIINDISMGISPSDIQLFDNNYVYEQSFLRSNSVYCYRSKYSDTKVVLNFPFKIEMDGTKEEEIHTTNCLKLIAQLNSYPFCFIKNSRVRTYISPMVISSTGYLMFAVEELALIQSAAASNVMFFEVTLRYFNFAPVAADFEFVDNNAVYKSARQTVSGMDVEYERDMIQKATTTRVSDLSVSSVWAHYMNPKIERLYEEIDRKGVMRSSTKSSDVKGLGVDIYLPMILSNADRARHLIQEDDGAFVGPDSKFVITTDVENLDDHDLPNMIQALFSQDFRDEEEQERAEKDTNRKLETTNTNALFSPEELKMIEDGTKVNKKFEANAIKSGKRELFINYSSVALNSLGVAIQKVEVRRSNNLVSQKIGTYKHPIIQYMGRNPARTNIQFLNNTTNLYTSNDEVGASAFIVNALQILDENRMNYPAAEVYNHIKINSLANVLLKADSALPNQNMVSSSADQGGVENIVYSFTETTTEKFLESFQMEASGARSFNKAYDEVYSIVLNWLSNFKDSLQSGKLSNISSDPVISTNTLKIFKTALDTVSSIIREMGYKDSIDDSAIQNAYKLEGDGLLSVENENKVIRLLRTAKHATGSGVVLYVNPESYSTVLTEEEEKAEVITEESKEKAGFWTSVAQTLLGVSSDAVANAYLPGITTEVKKKVKHDQQVASGNFAKVNLLPGSYYFWLSSYIITMITARRAAKEGKSLNLKNVSFRPTNMTDTLMMNTAALIGASADTDPISAKLTAGQKNFLGNMADLYIGSLYGQNLEDLYLEDLDESYDVSKDVLIQSTDPFFFLRTPLVLGDEMIDFYNNTYGDVALNPKIVADADAINEPAVTQADALLGVEYRKIYEVDFNAENFPYYGDSDPLPTDYEHIAVNNEDARRAIENALAKYGYSGDEEFRRYMYKAAYLESGMGTKLTSGSGASGLFQFTAIAISEIMTKDNKVFTKEGYVGLSKKQAKIAAAKVKARASFKRDFQLSADMFIELFNINGKKHINPKTKVFDEAFTFAYHNIGPGGGAAIEEYLTKNVLHPSNPEVQKAMRGNAASGNQLSASWYGIFSAKFKKARMQLGGKLKGDGAPEKEKILQSDAVLNLSSNNEKINTNKQLIDTKKGVIQSSVSTGTLLNKAPVTSLLTQQANKVVAQSQESLRSSARQVNVVGTTVNATVKGIVDGDTIDITYLSNNKTAVTQRVRLAGLNTEETWENTEGTKDWGEEAKKRIATLLPLGSKVTLNMTNNEARPINEQEVAQQRASGRWIAIVKNNEGVDVSKDLLSKGLAKTFFNTSQEYQEAMNTAQKSSTGQWTRTTVAAYNEAKVKASKSPTIYKEATSNIDAADILKGATDKTRKFNTYQPFQNGQRFAESSPFTYGGPRKDMNRSSPHNGLDIGCPVGTVVVAAASGIATQRFQADKAGLYVTIDHGNGFVTKYMHLSSTNISKKGQKIAAGQPIGKSGGAGGNPNSGGSTGAHLHYEVRFKGRAIHPYSTKKLLTEYTSGEVFTGDGSLGMAAATPSEDFLSLSYEARPNITEENTVFSEDELAQAILTGARDDVNIGLKVAVPAIKAYIMVGNENDGLGLDTLTTGSQYYELKGIQSFKLFCNNNETPVDTAIMTIIDPSFGNTDAWTSLMKAPEIDFDSIGSDYETQFKFNRALIRPGTKLSIRMGYGNDPNYLTTVFNGGVTEVNNGDSNQIMTLLLEGYGRELLSEIRNPDQPKALEDADNSPTTAVIGYALESKPIDHFGYMNSHLKWLYKDENDPEARAMVKPISSDHAWWFTTSAAVHRSRLYMNIFAPEIERVDDTFAKNWAGQFLQSIGLSNHQFGYPFYAYQATPWDMCKQMEYRHPGSIFKPMMFEDRMTPFYGIKEQMYFSRDLSRFTQIEVAKRLKSGLKDATTQKYFDRRRERMSPVSNIHMVSSSTNLISNQIQLNGKWKTCTNVSYFTRDTSESFAESWNWDSIRMEVDDNILPWEIREKELRMSGTFGKYPAFLYGTTDLKKEAETMYSGKLLITGNAKVKCGDYIFIDDLDNRLSGLALVRECIQHFDPVNGFVTEITPGLYVEPAQFMYTSLWLQLMCAMKVGSSKSRLVLSSSFSSEYEYVREYLRVVQQLRASDSGDYSTPTEVIAGYGAAVGLGFFLSYALGKALGSKTPLPGQSFGKLAYTFVSAHFRTAERKLAVERLKKIRRSEWYTSGARTIKGWKSTVSSKVIGSAAYKATMSTRTARVARFVVRRSPLFTVPTWTIKKASGLATRVALRSSIAAVHGVASVNPITFTLDVVMSLIASWMFAKIEESDLTRQPLLFFPLIKHGKPYQAGMTGSIRNSYWDSFGREWDKTTNAISKAAAIYEGTSIANNKQAPFLLSMLAQPAKRDKEERADTAYVMTSVGNDHEFYTRKTEVEKEAEQRRAKEAQDALLKKATKEQ